MLIYYYFNFLINNEKRKDFKFLLRLKNIKNNN